MSGIYLIVWEESETPVLKRTAGGYPHVTVCYSGKLIDRKQLLSLATKIMESTVLQKVTIKKAYVNSFVDGNGKERHDVLLSLSSKDEKMVEKCRESLFNVKGVYMGVPHITAKICDTKGEAEAYAKQFSKHLPFNVTITGVTID